MDAKKTFQQLGHKTLNQIAKENNLSRQELVTLWDQAGLTGRSQVDPSPSEIAEATRKIRSEWSEKQRSRRWIAAKLIRRSADFSFMEGR